MSDNGVTKGGNPPANDKYCPDGFVTREQMAAFMHRLETEGVFSPADHERVALFDTATDGSGVTHTDLVNGTEMQPASSFDYRFDASEGNSATSAYTEGHAMERVSGTLSSGTYTVTVQVVTVTNFPPLSFRLDDWILVAEAKLTS